MADNVAITAGSGTNIAADDVGGVLFQRVKPAFGVDGSATDVSAGAGLPVSSGYTEVACTPTSSLNGDLIASTDVSAYRWFSIQVTGTWSGTITLTGSNDNTNFFTIGANRIETGTVGNTVTSNGCLAGPLNFKYLRVRMTSYSSGTATGVLLLSTVPSAQQNLNIAQIVSIPNSVNVNQLSLANFSTAFASASRTTTQTGSPFTVSNVRGLRLLVNVTSAGTGSITPRIQGRDEISTTYFDLLAGPTITANGLYVMTVYPGIDSLANYAANSPVSYNNRIVIDANNANAMTYSVGYHLIP